MEKKDEIRTLCMSVMVPNAHDANPVLITGNGFVKKLAELLSDLLTVPAFYREPMISRLLRLMFVTLKMVVGDGLDSHLASGGFRVVKGKYQENPANPIVFRRVGLQLLLSHLSPEFATALISTLDQVQTMLEEQGAIHNRYNQTMLPAVATGTQAYLAEVAALTVGAVIPTAAGNALHLPGLGLPAGRAKSFIASQDMSTERALLTPTNAAKLIRSPKATINAMYQSDRVAGGEPGQFKAIRPSEPVLDHFGPEAYTFISLARFTGARMALHLASTGIGEAPAREAVKAEVARVNTAVGAFLADIAGDSVMERARYSTGRAPGAAALEAIMLHMGGPAPPPPPPPVPALQ